MGVTESIEAKRKRQGEILAIRSQFFGTESRYNVDIVASAKLLTQEFDQQSLYPISDKVLETALMLAHVGCNNRAIVVPNADAPQIIVRLKQQTLRAYQLKYQPLEVTCQGNIRDTRTIQEENNRLSSETSLFRDLFDYIALKATPNSK